MWRVKIISMIFLVGISLVPNFVFADYRDALNTELDAVVGKEGANFMTPARDPLIVIALIIRYALTLVGTLFFAYGVFAGYTIILSKGNEEKMEIGKKTLRTATIGVLLALSAYSLIILITSLLRIGNTNTEKDYLKIFSETSGQPAVQSDPTQDRVNTTPLLNRSVEW